MSNEFKKSLNKIDSPLVRQTVEFMISKIEEAPDTETCDIAKSALLLYLESAAPYLLKNTVAVSEALNKSDQEILEEEVTDSLDFMTEAVIEVVQGLIDSLEKHQHEGPEWLHPLPHPPHGNFQEPHGNRPGKRTLIGLLQVWRKVFDPKIDKVLPKHKDLLQMSHEDLLKLAGQHIHADIITGVGKIIRSVSGNEDSMRRRSIDGSKAHRIYGRGQGKNLRYGEYLNSLKDLLSTNRMNEQSKTVRVVTEAPRRPGKDVIDYEANINPSRKPGAKLPPQFKQTRFKNEGQITRESKVPGTGGGRESLGSLSRSGSIEDHPEYVPGQPLSGILIPNPMKSRASNERDRRKLSEFARNLDTSGVKDERISAHKKPEESIFEPLPANVTSIDQIKNTALSNLYAKLNSSAKKKVMDRLSQGSMTPSDLNSYLRGLAEQPVNLVPRSKRARKTELGRKSRLKRADQAAADLASEKARASQEFRSRNPKPAPTKGVQEVINTLDSKTAEPLSTELKNSAVGIDKLVSEMVANGTDRSAAVNVLSEAAVKLEHTGDQLAGLKAEEKTLGTNVTAERAKVAESMNTVLDTIKELGYPDLAAYFEDKLNIGQTISSIMSSANIVKKNDVINPEDVKKFFERLNKHRSPNQGSE